MDRVTAARTLRSALIDHALRPFDELARSTGELVVFEVDGDDGIRYQVELEAHRVAATGAIQVVAGIDDGTIRGALRPVTDGFIMDPDGTVRMRAPPPVTRCRPGIRPGRPLIRAKRRAAAALASLAWRPAPVHLHDPVTRPSGRDRLAYCSLCQVRPDRRRSEDET